MCSFFVDIGLFDSRLRDLVAWGRFCLVYVGDDEAVVHVSGNRNGVASFGVVSVKHVGFYFFDRVIDLFFIFEYWNVFECAEYYITSAADVFRIVVSCFRIEVIKEHFLPVCRRP